MLCNNQLPPFAWASAGSWTLPICSDAAAAASALHQSTADASPPQTELLLQQSAVRPGMRTIPDLGRSGKFVIQCSFANLLLGQPLLLQYKSAAISANIQASGSD